MAETIIRGVTVETQASKGLRAIVVRGTRLIVRRRAVNGAREEMTLMIGLVAEEVEIWTVGVGETTDW